MNKDIFKGSILTLVILCLFGIVFAVGFHTADEIISGNFNGDYSFKGVVKLDNNASVCNSVNEGSIKYESGLIKVCDGINWNDVGGVITSLGNDAFTKLLLHMDDVGLSDSSLTSQTISKFGGISLTSSKSKFGGNSAYFDGVDDYLNVPDSDALTLNGDFTIDFWINIPDNTYVNCIFSSSDDDAPGFMRLYWHPGIGGWELNLNNTINIDFLDTISNNVWYHIAITRDGNVVRLYKNGIQIDVDKYNSNIVDAGTNGFNIGNNWLEGVNIFNGYIDEFRISKGVVRWTGPFTPPTEPYS